ncbi:MAG: TIGR03621 family F420-dependent LLM class oxidoreductase [Actinomycetota bacterium]
MPQPFRFSASLASTGSDDLVGLAQRAEELGYSAVTLSDHFYDQPAPLIGLTAAAAATTSLRVLPLVLANDYRHPVVLAKEIATLDKLSNGRVEFGIGAGWLIADYEQAGMPYDSAGVRIRRLREAVDVLQRLFAGEDLDVDGEFYTVKGPLSEPTPVQTKIPLMLAGGKEKMLKLAGEKADIIGINPGLTAGVIDERAGQDATQDKTDQKIAWVREGAGDRFDDLELQTRIHLTMITNDRHKVAAEMAPLLGISAEDALNSPHALVGSAEELIDDIKRWRDRWGISFVSINGENMDEFAPVVEALAGT